MRLTVQDEGFDVGVGHCKYCEVTELRRDEIKLIDSIWMKSSRLLFLFSLMDVRHGVS